MSTCVDCDPGTYSTSASYLCIACEPGKYSTQPSASSCLDCDVGKYSTAVGASSACNEVCAAGTYSDAGATKCKTCPQHSSSAPGSSTCTCNEDFVLTPVLLLPFSGSSGDSSCSPYTDKTCSSGDMVKRGPDWPGEYQQTGQTIGFVVDGGSDSKPGWCFVQWVGSETVRGYRVGDDDTYELCEVDVSQKCVSHTNCVETNDDQETITNSIKIGSHVMLRDSSQGNSDCPLTEGEVGTVIALPKARYTNTKSKKSPSARQTWTPFLVFGGFACHLAKVSHAQMDVGLSRSALVAVMLFSCLQDALPAGTGIKKILLKDEQRARIERNKAEARARLQARLQGEAIDGYHVLTTSGKSGRCQKEVIVRIPCGNAGITSYNVSVSELCKNGDFARRMEPSTPAFLQPRDGVSPSKRRGLVAAGAYAGVFLVRLLVEYAVGEAIDHVLVENGVFKEDDDIPVTEVDIADSQCSDKTGLVFCDDVIHHQVSSHAMVSASLRDTKVERLYNQIIVSDTTDKELTMKTLTETHDICKLVTKQSLCLSAFPSCNCEDLTACVNACDLLNECALAAQISNGRPVCADCRHYCQATCFAT